MRINNSQVALLLVDVQNDFLPGGALAVKEGDRILPVIQKLQGQFSRILATQDFHPKDHESFAANHPSKNPGDVIDLHGLPQVLWPVHCVQGTWGAAFSEQLQTSSWEAIFQKGKNKSIDSYSGFDATRAVNLRPQDGEKALEELKHAGVKLMESTQVLTYV
ncbi:MAG: isochorismatase family protein [Algoriphagus sp.]|nr:isochorismatase family protein [Algoriphagus sp.]